MRKVSLDSNTYTSYVNGDSAVNKELEKADVVYVSTIVIGELLAAFKRGKKESDNLECLEDFLSKPTVEITEIGKETAQIYGQIKNLLAKSGTPIPSNDLWIAASAIESGSILITYDKHFLEISGLRLWDKLN